jgi:TonB family protein
MQKAKIAAAILFIFATSSRAQQQNAGVDPSPQQSNVIARSPNSTDEDLAVPLCTTTLAGSLGSNRAAEANHHVKAPVAIHTVEASFTDQARRAIKKAHIRIFNDTVLINLAVDETGYPQNLCLRKSLGYGLDANAAKAVRQYRFIPATRDGEFIAEWITVEIDYKLW